MYYYAGLAPLGIPTLRNEYPLVHARCHYKVLDVYTIAEVVQVYYSNTTYNRNIEYVFPLPPGAAVCSFKAILDNDKVIRGIVKDRNEAKYEYNEAVARGQTAGLLQQEHADVFRVSLGNVLPKQEVKVCISFVSIIPHDGNTPQSLRITMPVAIAPRYGVAPRTIPWSGKHNANQFELTVALQMGKSITSVSSPSHPINLVLGSTKKKPQGSHDPSKAFIHFGNSAFLDNDIVVIVSAQDLDVPRCTVERWLASDGSEDTTDAYALTLVPRFDLPALPSQEYIFLVDRSGSMGGGRINAVKAALQIMLKSLPSQETLFNLISFGSHSTRLWKESQLYTEETVAHASNHVDAFTASYGGTELVAAIKSAFESRDYTLPRPSADNEPVAMFLLTDGEAWDMRGVVDVVQQCVEKARKQNKLLRVFVLGVGDQVSAAMCEGIARAGNGVAVFVNSGEEPDAKLMSLLKAARGGVIEDLAVEWGNTFDDEVYEMTSGPSAAPQSGPAPHRLPALSLFDTSAPQVDVMDLGPRKIDIRLSLPPVIQQAPKSDRLPIPLYPGFRCSIFAIIRQSANPGSPSNSIRITGRVMGRDVEFETPVAPIGIGEESITDGTEKIKLLHTLAARALIQGYEDMPSNPEIQAQIRRLGIRYSLASSATSFLAIDQAPNGSERPTLLHKMSEWQKHTPQVDSIHGYIKVQPRSIQVPPMLQYSILGGPEYSQPNARTPYSGNYGPGGRNLNEYDPTVESYDPTICDDGGYGGQEEYSCARPPRPRPTNYNSGKQSSSDMHANDRGGATKGLTIPGLTPLFNLFSSTSMRKKRESVRFTASINKQKPDFVPTPFAPSLQAAASAIGATFPSLPTPISPTKPPIILTRSLTLEEIARAQNFDGSFLPVFLERMFMWTPPTMPAILSKLRGRKETAEERRRKGVVWATVLVLAYLKGVLMHSTSSWEMMAEKANGFVGDALKGMGADADTVRATLIAEAGGLVGKNLTS